MWIGRSEAQTLHFWRYERCEPSQTQTSSGFLTPVKKKILCPWLRVYRRKSSDKPYPRKINTLLECHFRPVKNWSRVLCFWDRSWMLQPRSSFRLLTKWWVTKNSLHVTSALIFPIVLFKRLLLRTYPYVVRPHTHAISRGKFDVKGQVSMHEQDLRVTRNVCGGILSGWWHVIWLHSARTCFLLLKSHKCTHRWIHADFDRYVRHLDLITFPNHLIKLMFQSRQMQLELFYEGIVVCFRLVSQHTVECTSPKLAGCSHASSTFINRSCCPQKYMHTHV
jgi:hypothetical protein